LLGGAGSLAYWTADDDVDGGTLTAGTLKLNDVTCGTAWLDVNGITPVALLVPGDEVTKECTGTITMTGDNIEATVTLDDASVATAEAAFNDAAPDAVEGDAVNITAALTGGGTISASGPISVTITVDWNYGAIADNESQGVSTAALDALEINAVQVDPNP
ncbi:MAG: alternate-type signal peptide domain-containing protein, partial [Aeromicrobium sp.]